MSKRHSWTKAYENYQPPDFKLAGRPARVRRATTTRMVHSCAVVTSVVDDGVIYQSTTGAWMKVSANAVVVCLPYPVSANVLWRASKSKVNDTQTNVLSFPARKYKKRVFDQFAPLFKSINWQNLNQLCEARIVVQPPCKSNNYSNKTYPRYDVDNYSKPVLDCLKGKDLLFSDDRIFVSEKVEFAQPYQDGRVWLSCVSLDDVDWLNREVPHQWLSGSVELV